MDLNQILLVFVSYSLGGENTSPVVFTIAGNVYRWFRYTGNYCTLLQRSLGSNLSRDGLRVITEKTTLTRHVFLSSSCSSVDFSDGLK
ncbi:unnamed protein product [Microthlaspi erraticum]|uniref:Uncharacterized protein n=1 Tax=Microthlaspi erraticum TaxID=1685480 RepID=A0A6D2JL78_9BRAS|nr:unnamed protein product [Microthlaspi erraticum]